jgi:23S rRNA (pseudouridine1915-N3)-methyltransferase
MPRELAITVMEIKPEPRTAKTPEQSKGAEKSRILHTLSTLGEKIRLVALDEKGDDLNTREFSAHLQRWMQDGRDTAFLIGGADGLDAELKARADAAIRLSSLTLPHGMARLLLCEQLYRAVSLLKNHPYHRQ